MPSRNTYRLTWVSLTWDMGSSLHSCSSKAQPLLLILDKVAPPDLEGGVTPLGPHGPTQPPLLECGIARLGRRPDVRRGVARLGPPAPTQPPLLGCGVAPLGHSPMSDVG